MDTRDPEKLREYLEYLNTLTEKERELLVIMQSQESNLRKFLKGKKNLKDASKTQRDIEEEIKQLEITSNKIMGNNQELHKKYLKSLATIYNFKKGELTQIRAIRLEEKRRQETVNKTNSLGKDLLKSVFGFKMGFNFLDSADKSIKLVNKEMGIVGARGNIFRDSLIDASIYSARLGVSVNDLSIAQSRYADETGRALTFNTANMKAISEIAKGTILGIEGAAQLAGQMENVGFSAINVRDFVQDTLDASDKYAVNAGKVLKSINTNFKAAQRFTFRNGVQDLAKMVVNSERFKMDMTSTFSAMEKARSLEGAVEMAAKMQMLGGQFAKVSPFDLLFTSRNDPEAFQRMMADTLKGMSQFQKGIGFSESALDLDKLRIIAETTGQSLDSLIESSRRVNQNLMIDKMALNLNKDQKEFIKGIAQLDATSGKVTVQLDGATIKDITKLSPDEIKALMSRQKRLDEIAKESQNFQELFQNNVMLLQSTLLPFMKMTNKVLTSLNSGLDMFGNLFNKYMPSGSASMLGGGLLLLTSVPSLLKIPRLIFSGVGSLGGVLTGFLGKFTGVFERNSSKLPSRDKRGRFTSAKRGGGKLGGLGSMAGAANIAAIGAAGYGLGKGIGIAVDSLSNFISVSKDVPIENLKETNNILKTMGMTFAGFGVAAGIVGAMGPKAALGMGILSAGTLALGYSINLASKGIGEMVGKLGVLSDGNIPTNIKSTAVGITALAGSTALMANPLSVGGLASVTGSMLAISRLGSSKSFENIANSFGNIKEVISSDYSRFEKFKELLEYIKNYKMNSSNPLKEIKDLFSKPLKVEFDTKEVNLVVNLDVNLDSDKIARNLNIGKRASVEIAKTKSGRMSSRI